MSAALLTKKLRLDKARHALILNAPDGYFEALGEMPEGVMVEREAAVGPAGSYYDFAHLFVQDKSELELFIDPLLGLIEPEAVLWISYPKGGSGASTDLNRDSLRKELSGRGIRPVSQVSVDNVWSAMRFKPEGEVGK